MLAHVVLLTIYALVLGGFGSGPSLPWAPLVLFGLYYAGSEGVLHAAASAVRREDQRTGGLAVLNTLTGAGRLVGSLAFGCYASVDFTTQTLLLRIPSGDVLGDLESFQISRDGKPFRREDFTFWGVTFAPDSNRFFCTLSTGRKHYLVEGDVAARSGRVIHDNVECPSLSPDETRIAYKKRLPGSRAVWQLHVLDLETGQSLALAERRNVDDQLEWLDNQRVLYALPRDAAISGPTTDVWSAATDGSSKPRVFLAGAYSPSVER